jgi:hypothetical protein
VDKDEFEIERTNREDVLRDEVFTITLDNSVIRRHVYVDMSAVNRTNAVFKVRPEFNILLDL